MYAWGGEIPLPPVYAWGYPPPPMYTYVRYTFLRRQRDDEILCDFSILDLKFYLQLFLNANFPIVVKTLLDMRDVG